MTEVCANVEAWKKNYSEMEIILKKTLAIFFALAYKCE